MKRISLKAMATYIVFAVLLMAGQALAQTRYNIVRHGYNPGGYWDDPVIVRVIPVSTTHVSYKTVRTMFFRFEGGCLQWVRSAVLFTYTDKTEGSGPVVHSETVTDLGTEVLYEYCVGR